MSNIELSKQSLQERPKTKPTEVASDIARYALIGFTGVVTYAAEKTFSFSRKNPKIMAAMMTTLLVLGSHYVNESGETDAQAGEQIWADTPCVGQTEYVLPSGRMLWGFVRDIEGIESADVMPVILQIDKATADISDEGHTYQPGVTFIGPTHC